MKLFNKIRNVAAFVMVMLLTGACTKDFEEINTSPTLLTEEMVQPATLFTSAVKNSVFNSFDTNRVHEFAGYFGYQASANIFQNMDFRSPFNHYQSYIINLNEVIRLTADDPQLNDQNAMAKIMKVWNFIPITDAYGDIPYHEAALGIENVINQPVYDTQEEIYRSMLNELKAAEAQLGSLGDQVSFGNADIIYQGDVVSWKKLANSLRLRLAIRVRFVDEGLAQQHISEVINAPLIEENSENAYVETLPHTETEITANINPIYIRYLTTDYPKFVGFPVTDIMVPANDPRLPILVDPIESDPTVYRGRPLQLLQEEIAAYSAEETSGLGPFLKAEIYKIIIMNAAEVYFLRAEAALAGLTGEDSNDMFSEGIRTSLEQYGVAQGDIDSFLSQEEATLDGTEEEQLEQIIDQKFIAIFYQADEAYAEYRRTGYPVTWLGSEQGVTGGIIPRRYTYPQDEYLKNEVNVLEAAARMGGDNLLTRVWWDVRPGLPFEHPLQDQFPPN